MARQALQSDPANKRLFSHKPMMAGLVRLLGDCDSGADFLARARLR